MIHRGLLQTDLIIKTGENIESGHFTQLIEILSKSQYGQVQHPKYRGCSNSIVIVMNDERALQCSTVVLQICPHFQIFISRWKKTCTKPNKSHIIMISKVFLSENEKM